MNTEQYDMFVGLTRHNYFPNQKSSTGELPPIISTRTFTPEVALKISREKSRSDGYDAVVYLSTRFNNAPRELSLVHPKAYSSLVTHIVSNWDKIKFIQENSNSIIKPEQHQDGRVLVMNYEDPIDKSRRILTYGFGKRFLVKADISNCFNSIYSHAISWGLVGIPEAKAAKNKKEEWFNKYDYYQRSCKRQETQGVPIGPGTSNVALESILYRVDSALRDKGFEFSRYVDDYECYCKDDSQAQYFINTLRNELYRYKFSLNSHKTKIIPLPSPDGEEWIMELMASLPRRLSNAMEGEPELSTYESTSFINRAIKINNDYPDGSVLKYALSTIMPFISNGAAYDLYVQTLTLAWHYPILIPYLEPLINKSGLTFQSVEKNLNALIMENCQLKRSDGISWPLYIIKRLGGLPSHDVINRVIDTHDCVSITLLYELTKNSSQLMPFVNYIINSGDNYLKDSQWLLLYQLFRDGVIKNPYNDNTFNILLENEVNFITSAAAPKTDAEKTCDQQRLRNIFQVFQPLNITN
ncbi:RNA-directed DNA polymerase [Aeromonas veronii]|uniref:antiviral reverse transcriptase Drt4 n=1 Tax=Aeromonas veronii TaxID=654 RepID=UPI001F3DAFCC|nr:antiviral reverse transcriptase Drt4 [Aeromonas veronii]MCF5892166.1 RNA-directed DNA polymerase [Aeromonas veronii]